jgi:hypothetical protein
VAGGNQSAFGYRYEYLATIERFLRFMRDHLGELGAMALHVEPTTLMREGIAPATRARTFACSKGPATPKEGSRQDAPLEASLVVGHPEVRRLQLLGPGVRDRPRESPPRISSRGQ